MFCRLVAALAALAWLGSQAPLVAQNSRVEQIAGLQAEKAAVLEPYSPPLGERVMIRLEDFFQGIEPIGFYPWFGSIYPGGFLALGAGHRSLFAGNGSVNVLGAWSLRDYRLLQAEVKSPTLADDRLRLSGHVTRLHADAVNFYGIGNDTRRAGRRRYQYDPLSVGGSASWRAAGWLEFGGGLDYLDARAALRGEGEPREDVQYTVTRGFAAVDWRDSPGYSRRGGLYRIEASSYTARHDDPFSFRRTEAEVVQLWPILRAQWVLAFRGLMTTTHVDEGEIIPYFMLPQLGGGSTLRGFRSWRFRDRHRLLLSGEYRWTPGELLDVALFYDAGKVASRVSDLELRGMHQDFGISLRIHSPTFVGLRADLARSREGWIFRLGSGTAF